MRNATAALLVATCIGVSTAGAQTEAVEVPADALSEDEVTELYTGNRLRAPISSQYRQYGTQGILSDAKRAFELPIRSDSHLSST